MKEPELDKLAISQELKKSGFSTRTSNALAYHGIKKEDLLNFSRSDLLKLPSIGKSICDEIERTVWSRG